MNHRRSGFTLIELILLLAVVGLLVAGWILWHRVETLNAWAAKQEVWHGQVYDWIKNSSFQQGTTGGGSNPDGVKPPAPPDEL